MSFLSAVQQARFLILDGALGTELARRGIVIELPLWSANAILHNPQAIVEIHSDYIRAGADIITTATFRTDSLTFTRAGLTEKQAAEATFQAVELAREAIADVHSTRQIWIAGSIAPLADCYEPESAPDFNTALRIHRQRAQWLAEAGVDFALLETMNNLSEAKAASIAALETGLPVFTSFILAENGALLSGENIWSVMNKIKMLGVSGLGINCTHHSLISNFLENYRSKFDLPLILYANAGIYSRKNGWCEDPNFTPQNYARIAANWLKSGAKIIGGCCGTTPDYIKALADLRKSPV